MQFLSTFLRLNKKKSHFKVLSLVLTVFVIVTGYLQLLFFGNLYRQTFVKALEPFVNWLEEAEEEE
jgi:hypothetical protein